MASLIVKDLSYAFGKLEILQHINFSLKQGQIISVVGPSGSGKTTLLRLCANLMDLDKGEVFNQFLSSAFVFQEPRLLPWQNVIDNISIGLRAQKVDKLTAIDKAKKIALEFGLVEDDFDKFPAELSGGMRQRAAFARALILEPQLLFLDEPFSALDIGLKKELQNHLLALAAKKNMSVLFITHDLMEAVRLSDVVLLLKGAPGAIAHQFKFKTPQQQRDDSYVFSKVAELLKHPIIQETFELTTAASSQQQKGEKRYG